MTIFAPFFVSLFWFGPAAALLLLSLVLERRRNAQNGENPEANVVRRSLLGGFTAAAIWMVLVFLLVLISGAGNAGLWSFLAPWAFAVGQAGGLIWPGKPAARDCE